MIWGKRRAQQQEVRSPSTDILLSKAVMLAGQVEELVYRLYQRMAEEEAQQ